MSRLTTAGTGGTVVGPLPFDQSDAGVGATAMTLPTAKGAEGATLARFNSYMTQTPGAAGLPMLPVFEWPGPGRSALAKPIKIPNGVTNGICIRNDTAIAGATVTGYVVFAELANF
jgi:hypothetical protein